jgi:Kef-type K+ transport system membrane component KefB
MIPLLLLLAVGSMMHAVRGFGDSSSLGGSELAFGYLLLSAYFSGQIASRLGLPKLTGYLVVGVISGPFVLSLVTPPMSASLKIVSGVATCIIALTAGSELNLQRLKPTMSMLRNMTVFAVIGAQFAIAGALYAMRPWLGFFDAMTPEQSMAVCFCIAVALSAQSPAVVMALLSETASEGPLSQVILGSVVFADLVVLVMYSAAAAITGAMVGGGLDVLETALSVTWQLLGSIAFGVAIGMLLGHYVRLAQKGAALFAVVVCVVVAEVGPRIGLDPLIVMLAAGVWLENFSRADAHDLLLDFDRAQLPVFLVFFALAGGKIDLDLLYASLTPVAILCVVRAACFFVGTKIASARAKPEPVVSKYAWMGLVPQSGLALALALLVQNTFPSFGPPAAAIIFGVVGVNEVVSPIILRTMLIRSGEAGRRAALRARSF